MGIDVRNLRRLEPKNGNEKFVIGDGALDEGGEGPELQVGIEGGVGAAEEDGLLAVELPHDGFRAEQAFV